MSELNIGAFEGDDSKGVDSLYDTLVELDTRTPATISWGGCDFVEGPAGDFQVITTCQLFYVTSLIGTAIKVDAASSQILNWRLSDSADGTGPAPFTPGSVFTTGEGTILTGNANASSGTCQTNDFGYIDFTIAHLSGAGTAYIVFTLPDSTEAVSGAVTFT